MNDIFQYLLKWSIALGVVYLFYRFALRPLTFYQWNRRYLILYSMVAFMIPFVNLYTYLQPQKLQGIALVQYIPAINIDTAKVNTAAASTSINPLFIAAIVILAGSLVLLARLVMQWYSLRRIRRRAIRLYHPEANVYHVDENVIPFSFGNAIFVNTSLHTEKELNDIILHEFVHVRQKHSFDIIWSEILCILNWYNPFAWFIRHAIRQNLEFIADQAVLQHGLDKKTYQYHLLRVIGSPQYSIANNFNFSSLKKRIAMMNRLKSARMHLVRFLFVLPLLAVLLVAFRNNEGWYKDIKNDTIKKPEVQETEVREIRLVHLKEFYKNNPSVKEVAWSDDDEIIIYLRNGQRESYKLHDRSDMKKFQSVYGSIPTIISKPIMPPPPLPLVEVVDVYVTDETGRHLKGQLRADKTPPIPPSAAHPPVKVIPLSPPALPEGVSSIELQKNVLYIKLENGKTETYDLTKPAEKAAAEKKYGEIIKLQEIPKVVPKKPTAVMPAVIETPSTKAAVEPVIVLEGTGNEQASVRVIQDDTEHSAYADKIVIHSGVSQWNVRPNEAAKPVYYLNGKRSVQQNPKLIAAEAVVSHLEIVSNKAEIAARGETAFNVIINVITKENKHNKSAYVAEQSRKTIQEASKASSIHQ